MRMKIRYAVLTGLAALATAVQGAEPTDAASYLVLRAASVALRRGRARAAFAFGAAFLVAQAALWRHLVARHLGPGAGDLGGPEVLLRRDSRQRGV